MGGEREGDGPVSGQRESESGRAGAAKREGGGQLHPRMRMDGTRSGRRSAAREAPSR